MKRGCRLECQPSANNHVDTLAFWRYAFKKSEDAQNELRAKIFELEKRLETRIEQRSENPVSQTKRKRDLDSAAVERSSTTASKRLKPADSTLSGSEGFPAAIPDDVKHLPDQKGRSLYLGFDGTGAYEISYQAFSFTTYTASSSWQPRETSKPEGSPR